MASNLSGRPQVSPRLTRRVALAGVLGSVWLRPLLRAQTVASRSAVDGLRASLTGQLIVPGDAGYDSARRLVSFNPRTDKHPQMIVRCATGDDVIRAITFAREREMEVAVRSGGHDVLGASVCDGIVIDLSRMKKIASDPAGVAVQVEPGVRTGELNGTAQQFGYAAVLGCNPGVGVAGLTLGGGLGWFLGKHGASCDYLLGADLITAEGKMIRASPTENPELFWALRGGGGNFGIVTAMDLQLHPVKEVLGGVLVTQAEVSPFLRFYRDFMQSAPDEMTVEITIMPGFRPVIVAIVCWSGDLADGESALEPLRAFSTPLADWVEHVAYARLTDPMARVGSVLRQVQPQLQRPVQAQRQPQPTGPGYNYWKGGSLSELGNASVEQIAVAVAKAPPGCSFGLGHYMHGQACRVAPDATPLTRTAGQVTYFINAGWDDPTRGETSMQWVDDTWGVMKVVSGEGAYINYLSSGSPAEVRASYGTNYERLARIKKQYDPSNFFHRNRNIRA